MDAIGKPQANFYVSVCLMLFNLGATYLCLLQVSGNGRRYATVAFNIVSAFVLLAILKKYVKVEVRNIGKYMLGKPIRDLFGFARKKLIKSQWILKTPYSKKHSKEQTGQDRALCRVRQNTLQ